MLKGDKWMAKSHQNLNRFSLVILKPLKKIIPTQVPWTRIRDFNHSFYLKKN